MMAWLSIGPSDWFLLFLSLGYAARLSFLFVVPFVMVVPIVILSSWDPFFLFTIVVMSLFFMPCFSGLSGFGLRFVWSVSIFVPWLLPLLSFSLSIGAANECLSDGSHYTSYFIDDIKRKIFSPLLNPQKVATIFLLALDPQKLIYFFTGNLLKLFIEDAPGEIDQSPLS